MFGLASILIGILLWKPIGAGYTIPLLVWFVLWIDVSIYILISGLLLFAAFGARRRLTLGVVPAFLVQAAMLGWDRYSGWRPEYPVDRILRGMTALTLLLVPLARRVDRLRKRYPDLRSSGSGQHARSSDGRNAQKALVAFGVGVALVGVCFYRAFPKGNLDESELAVGMRQVSAGANEYKHLLSVDGFERTFLTLWNDSSLDTLYAFAARWALGEVQLDGFMEQEDFQVLPRASSCRYIPYGSEGPLQLLLEAKRGDMEVDMEVENGLVAWTGIQRRN